MVSHVHSFLPPVSLGTAWPQFANQGKQLKFNPALTQLLFMWVLFACSVPQFSFSTIVIFPWWSHELQTVDFAQHRLKQFYLISAVGIITNSWITAGIG